MSGKAVHHIGIIHINFRSTINVLIFVIFFLPPVVQNMAFGDLFLDSVRLFLCLVLVLHSLVRKKMKFTVMEMLLLLFSGWGLFITFAYAPEYLYQYAAGIGFKVVSMVFFVNNILGEKSTKSVHGIAVYFTALIWANALLMMLFPQGIFRSSFGAVEERVNWLFGSKNQVTLYTILAILFLYLDDIKFKKPFNRITIAVFAVEVVCMGPNGVEVMGGSTTALFVIILFAMMVIFHGMPFFKTVEKAITTRRIAMISIVFCALIWYISWNGKEMMNGALSAALAAFGKDTTFSARDHIWLNMFNVIVRRPLLGYGFREYRFGINGRAASLYSFWGSILLCFGIVGLLIIFAAFALCMCNGQNIRKNKTNTTIQFIFKLSLLLLMIFGLVNEIGWSFVVLLLELCNHSEVFYVNEKPNPSAMLGG